MSISMTTSDKHIDLSQYLEVTVLSNRATARTLIKHIQTLDQENIQLDFSDIEFASRSFMDQLNSEIKDLEQISVELINMNDQVSQMYTLVREKPSEDFWADEKPDKGDADLISM